MSDGNKTLEKQIGERIIKRRGRMTQQELAELCGVKRETVNQWESGTRQIKAGDLLRLSKALQCTVDFLTTNEKATAHDLSYIVEYTGLTEEAVESLNKLKGVRNDHPIDFISRLIENERLCLNIASGIKYISEYRLPDMSVPGNSLSSDMLYVIPGLYFRMQSEFVEFVEALVAEAKGG